VFRLQDTALATVFAPELLIAIGVMTILDYILALAMSTTADYRFCYHTPRLSRFTYFEPLPIFLGVSNELGSFESGFAAALFGPVIAVVAGGIGTLIVVLAVAKFWPEIRQLKTLNVPEVM